MTSLSLEFVDQLFKRIRKQLRARNQSNDDKDIEYLEDDDEINDLFNLNDMVKLALKNMWVKTGDTLSL